MKYGIKVKLLSFILPFTVTIIVPSVILWTSGDYLLEWSTCSIWVVIFAAAGMLLVACGLFFLSWTIRLFMTIGKGTLAPWSPTQKLVVEGPYRFVRNPMISGVLMILLGEALIFSSFGLLIWFIAFFICNHIYFVLSEEPGLKKRFGDSYLEYKKNVPRWIPRLKPWDQRM
jgi:protein-S-isoprenylcysteine O-methyltransferase Ste14